MIQSYQSDSRGFGLISTMIWILLIVGAASAAFKLGPFYLQFWTVRTVMDDTARDPETATMGRQAIIQTLEKKLYINEVRSVKNESFSFEKTDTGRILGVHYEVREHLFANLDAVLTFDHQTLIP
jgi:hypothetical protein